MSFLPCLSLLSFVNFMHHIAWVLTLLSLRELQASPKLTILPLLTKASIVQTLCIGFRFTMLTIMFLLVHLSIGV
jgi:hypothetical protein